MKEITPEEIEQIVKGINDNIGKFGYHVEYEKLGRHYLVLCNTEGDGIHRFRMVIDSDNFTYEREITLCTITLFSKIIKTEKRISRLQGQAEIKKLLRDALGIEQ